MLFGNSNLYCNYWNIFKLKASWISNAWIWLQFDVKRTTNHVQVNNAKHYQFFKNQLKLSLYFIQIKLFWVSRFNLYKCYPWPEGFSNLEGYWVKGYVHVSFCKHWYWFLLYVDNNCQIVIKENQIIKKMYFLSISKKQRTWNGHTIHINLKISNTVVYNNVVWMKSLYCTYEGFK